MSRIKMNKFGYRPTNGGYSGSKFVFDDKAKNNGSKFVQEHEISSKKVTKNYPSAPKSGSAQVKIKR